MSLWNKLRWVTVFCLTLTIFIPFQNCSEVAFTPSHDENKVGLSDEKGVLLAEAIPAMVLEGTTTQLTVHSENVHDVKYRCFSGLMPPLDPDQIPLKSGDLEVGYAATPITITQDLYCLVEAVNSNELKLQAEVKIPVDCGNRIKENGQCRDFACKQIVALTPGLAGALLQIPARSTEGLCFSLKIMDAIANSSSTLTNLRDNEIVSRTHGSGAGDNPTSHPYVLGQADVHFLLLGARNVRLNGAADALTQIRVDNYVLVGLVPDENAADLPADKVAFYRSYGTADSTIPGQKYILFRDQQLTLSPFGPGGTSTITPLDITAQVQAAKPYHLDVRALDCGGSRELSNIYLLFQ